VEYLELRSKYSEKNGGPQDLNKLDILDGPLGEIKDFKNLADGITAKVTQATKIIEDPLGAFGDPRDAIPDPGGLLDIPKDPIDFNLKTGIKSGTRC
jgi:hypothetical protein